MTRPTLTKALAASALAVAATALPATAASAQEIGGLDVGAGSTVLTVQGLGQSSREPDLALFSAGVATTGKTAKEALDANSAAMNRAIRSLRAAGIAERDIQTSNLSVSPVYASRSHASNGLEEELPPIIGYRANNQVMVRQRKLDEFGKVIDTLVSAGANQVSGPQFTMDSPDEAMDEARRKAMTAARERANLYAAAAGLRVRRILTITESGGYSAPIMVTARSMASDMAESTPVAPGEVEMQVNVQVAFELAP